MNTNNNKFLKIRKREGGIIMIDKSLNKILIFQKRKNYFNTLSTLAGQVTVAIGKQSVFAYTLLPLADEYT